MMTVRTLYTVHKWLGLGIGVWLILVTLTGTIWTVWDAVEASANDRILSTRCDHTTSAVDWRSALRARGEQIVRVDARDDSFRLLRVTVRDQDGVGHVRYVDQCVGTIARSSDAGARFRSAVTWLHGTLIPGGIGKHVIGLLGILTVISVMIGLWLWWVRGGRSLRKGLTISSSRHGIVRLRSWHGVVGAVATVLLVLSVASGVLLAYAPWLLGWPTLGSYCTVRGKVQGLEPHLDALLRIAHDRVPDGVIHSVRLDGKNCLARIDVHSRSITPESLKDRLWVDLPGSRLIAHTRGADAAVSQQSLAWASVIHSGEAFGRSGWLTTLAAGVVLFGLTVTGTWIYFWARASWQQAQSTRIRNVPGRPDRKRETTCPQ